MSTEQKQLATDMSVMPHPSTGGSFRLQDIKESTDWQKRIEPNLELKGKKYAIAFAYCGSKYQGLQVNPDALTVEALLERALLLSGLIDETKFGDFHSLSWTRAARTDKGVHALGQCCAAKLLLRDGDMTTVVANINQFLPDDIRVFHFSRVSKNFNAKNACFGRRYHYVLPTYACSDKKEMERLMTKCVLGEGVTVDPRANADGSIYKGGTKADNAAAAAAVSEGKSETSQVAKIFMDLEPEKYQEIVEDGKLKDYRISQEKLELLRSALKQYQGTHRYHNFTYHKSSSDASSSRYIISFIAEEPFVDPVSGVEWVCLQVEGQSFLLNQIRKMVAMALEVTRGGIAMATLVNAFAPGKMDLPIAPGIGLYLNELLFTKYNKNVKFENEKAANIKKKAALKAAAPTAVAVIAGEDESESGQCAKKQRLGVDGSSSAAAGTAPFIAPVALTDAGDNDDDTAEKETLDWMNKPYLRPTILKFKEEAVWSHIFREEVVNCDMLRYLHYTSFIAPRDFAVRSEK